MLLRVLLALVLAFGLLPAVLIFCFLLAGLVFVVSFVVPFFVLVFVLEGAEADFSARAFSGESIVAEKVAGSLAS